MCTSPLKAFKIGINANGKDILKITSYQVEYLVRFGDTFSYVSKEEAERSMPIDALIYPEKHIIKDWIEIPCGKCLQCRLQYSREWADRCMLELKSHDPNECWFVTLTYDDDHIHDYGHDIFPGILRKEDFQDFMKRLRDHCYRDFPGKDIRYFMCGEYGSHTFRPHYHAIIYSLPLPDIKPFCKTKKGFQLFESEYVEKIWKNGRVLIGKVSWDTCAYTARYVLKKATGIKPDDYINQGLTPEFTLMSRKPGIGANYFDKNYKKIYDNDEIFFSQDSGGRKSKPPKYFDRRLENIDPDWIKVIKEKRKEAAIASKELRLARTDLEYEDLLEIEDKKIHAKAKALKRESF